ncbi:hypothetical protein B7494_g4936 [Chlorociboria aeruginascens]|nr:hypothetical protein B7494_g4936 [Chlorociboria aeruginascens]
MASQSSLDDIISVSTPIQVPSTPQPLDTTIPSRDDIASGMSPSTSMIVATAGSTVSSQSTDDELPNAGTKYHSPGLVSSSMTPPPSTQVQIVREASPNGRFITRTASMLSSPPPTVANGFKRDFHTAITFTKPAAKEISEASAEELRNMLEDTLAENQKLELNAREARMSAAHYKLQHNLLSIETEEAAKRMEVEHDMTRREVEILQMLVGRGDPNPSGQEYIAKLKAFCQSLEEDHAITRRRLEKAKRVIELKDEQLAAIKEEKASLLRRIKENREHLNHLRSPGGIFHVATPKATNNSYPATPQQYRSTPKQTPMTNRSRPMTPILSRRPDPRTPNKHNRGAQSLSSLPTTPQSSRPIPRNSQLLPSVQFTAPGNPRPSVPKAQAPARQRERRRKSRDSTISASDAEEITQSYRKGSEEVEESQASQSATEMLRIDPRESFEVAASRTNTPTPTVEKNTISQSKLIGSVTKFPAGEKRKRVEDGHTGDYSTKKLRASVEGIGLGIGFEAARN